MKNSIKLNFVQNKEKGTVTCIAKNCSTELMKDLGLDLNLAENYAEEILISDTYVGVARLKGNDTWDAEVGVKISYDIVRKKIREAKLKKLNALAHISETLLQDIKKLKKKYLTIY